MKKIFLCLALTCSSTFLFSQTKFGIKYGANFATISENLEAFNELSTNPMMIVTMHLGGFAEIPLSKKLFFQPALLFSDKGYKIDYSRTEGGLHASLKQKENISYLEVPLNFLTKFPAGPGQFSIGAGPFVAYAISGKSNGDVVVDGPGTEDDLDADFSEDIEFGSNEDQVKPLDFGANILLGYELKKGILFNLGYGIGLYNIRNSDSETVRNRVLSLSIGYKF